ASFSHAVSPTVVRRASAGRSAEPDLTAALGHSAGTEDRGRGARLRYDELRCGFPAQSLQLLEHLLESDFRRRAELLHRFRQCRGGDLEAEWQCAARGQNLRLAGEDDCPARIRRAVALHGNELTDRPDL